MAYESNRPYNGISSNQPMQVVPVDRAMKRPGALEGAMWGAGQTMMGAAAFSAINEYARKSDWQTTAQFNKKLGAAHFAYQEMGNAADKVIDGQEKFSSVVKAAKADITKGRSKVEWPISKDSEKMKNMSSKEKMQYHAKKTVPDVVGRGLARNVFGTGWKNNLVRVGVAAIPGAITGALHNESNGIVGPY